MKRFFSPSKTNKSSSLGRNGGGGGDSLENDLPPLEVGNTSQSNSGSNFVQKSLFKAFHDFKLILDTPKSLSI